MIQVVFGSLFFFILYFVYFSCRFLSMIDDVLTMIGSAFVWCSQPNRLRCLAGIKSPLVSRSGFTCREGCSCFQAPVILKKRCRNVYAKKIRNEITFYRFYYRKVFSQSLRFRCQIYRPLLWDLHTNTLFFFQVISRSVRQVFPEVGVSPGEWLGNSWEQCRTCECTSLTCEWREANTPAQLAARALHITLARSRPTARLCYVVLYFSPWIFEKKRGQPINSLLRNTLCQSHIFVEPMAFSFSETAILVVSTAKRILLPSGLRPNLFSPLSPTVHTVVFQSVIRLALSNIWSGVLSFPSLCHHEKRTPDCRVTLEPLLRHVQALFGKGTRADSRERRKSNRRSWKIALLVD